MVKAKKVVSLRYGRKGIEHECLMQMRPMTNVVLKRDAPSNSPMASDETLFWKDEKVEKRSGAPLPVKEKERFE